MRRLPAYRYIPKDSTPIEREHGVRRTKVPIVYDDTPLEERTIPLITGSNALMTKDPKYGQVYLYIDSTTKDQKRNDILTRTEEVARGIVNFDFDAQGRLIGIEIY